jgi:hypothetical protein
VILKGLDPFISEDKFEKADCGKRSNSSNAESFFGFWADVIQTPLNLSNDKLANSTDISTSPMVGKCILA